MNYTQQEKDALVGLLQACASKNESESRAATQMFAEALTMPLYFYLS